MSQPSGSSLARTTLSRIRERIISGEWPVGSRIPTEPQLAALLGTGRSTVREAIRSLASLGMVETLTARGTFVRSATPAASLLVDVLCGYTPDDLLALRRALDVEAAQLAATRASDADLDAVQAVLDGQMTAARRGEGSAGDHCAAFHTGLARASGSRLLADLDATLSLALRADGLADHVAESADPATLLDEHDKILAAVRAQDAATAAHLAGDHVDAARDRLARTPRTAGFAALAPVPDVVTGVMVDGGTRDIA